ncbi:CueP family metal-binding protein, partial [Salmonella enterica]|nr:CueP family metal-binding protein [Salmonella enterica]EKD4188081.1 CueP family metal-binding protein [Salmonella enterica subsp. enterica serovar Kentucky]
SYRNGFIGIWLPRNMEGTLEVSYNGKTASHAIATRDDSQTCLTELPLR